MFAAFTPPDFQTVITPVLNTVGGNLSWILVVTLGLGVVMLAAQAVFYRIVDSFGPRGPDGRLLSEIAAETEMLETQNRWDAAYERSSWALDRDVVEVDVDDEDEDGEWGGVRYA